MHPLAGKFLGGPSWFHRGHMVCHCWLVETARDGLILVDTGLGRHASTMQANSGRRYSIVTGVHDYDNDSARVQVEKLGFKATDVRHIVLTHLDHDHAGGLVEFPWATVHVHAAELAAANERSTLIAKLRYEPSRWAHGVKWATYQQFGDTWMGLPATQALRGVEADIALVPLIGHTRGHSAVVLQTPTSWMLHAGDAIFHRNELGQHGPTPRGINALTSFLQTDKPARLASVGALRELAARGVVINSAHDPQQLPTQSSVLA